MSSSSAISDKITSYSYFGFTAGAAPALLNFFGKRAESFT
jgi:hypothetical protein